MNDAIFVRGTGGVELGTYTSLRPRERRSLETREATKAHHVTPGNFLQRPHLRRSPLSLSTAPPRSVRVAASSRRSSVAVYHSSASLQAAPPAPVTSSTAERWVHVPGSQLASCRSCLEERSRPLLSPFPRCWSWVVPTSRQCAVQTLLNRFQSGTSQRRWDIGRKLYAYSSNRLCPVMWAWSSIISYGTST